MGCAGSKTKKVRLDDILECLVEMKKKQDADSTAASTAATQETAAPHQLFASPPSSRRPSPRPSPVLALRGPLSRPLPKTVVQLKRGLAKETARQIRVQGVESTGECLGIAVRKGGALPVIVGRLLALEEKLREYEEEKNSCPFGVQDYCL